MSEAIDRSDVAAHMERAARLLRLPIPAERREAVLDHLMLAAQLAAIVEAFPLTDRDEAAAVFRP
ncbi:MAG: DUF4089 domain-containing protein [Alphaproteobacteria bacterium]